MNKHFFIFVLSSVILVGCSQPSQEVTSAKKKTQNSTELMDSVSNELLEKEPLENTVCFSCVTERILNDLTKNNFDPYPVFEWETMISIDKMKLLTPGEAWHGGEVYLGYGSHDMYALIEKEGSFEVIKTNVEVMPDLDLVLDEGPGQMTGKTISPDEEKALFVWEGGSIKTGTKPGKKCDSECNKLFWKEGGHEILPGFKMGFLGSLDPEDESATYNNFFFYVNNGLDYGFVLQNSFINGDAAVSWVGDLDDDGFPDYWINCSDHYNVNNMVLFLSSVSENPLAAAPVAQFRTTGC